MKLRALTAVEDESGLKGTSPVWRISILVTFVSLVVYIVGVGTSQWVGFDKEKYDLDIDDPVYLTIEDVMVDVHFGLWRKCVSYWVNGTDTSHHCEDMDNDEKWKPAAKWLCSAGIAIGILGLAAAIWSALAQNNKMMGVGGVTVVIAGICGAIGSAIFVGKAKDFDHRLEPRFSVFMALIGCAFLILGGGLQLLSIQSGYSTIA